jgi:hypothetical protein
MWKTNRASTTTRGWGSALLPTQKVVLDKICRCCYTVVKQKDLIFGKASPHPTHLDFLAEKSEQGVRKRYSVDHLSKQRGAGWQTGSLLFPKENNKTDPDQGSYHPPGRRKNLRKPQISRLYHLTFPSYTI